MAEGILPTFERLIARGTINRLMPSIAAWTPTNWAAQVTGAHPGIHGLGGWAKHHKTDPLHVPVVQSWESRDWQRWGLIREIDVAPTICHLMGLRPPRQNQGVVPYDLMRER